MSGYVPVLCDPKAQLTLSELLDIVGGGNSGLGPPGNVWRLGFYPSVLPCTGHALEEMSWEAQFTHLVNRSELLWTVPL